MEIVTASVAVTTTGGAGVSAGSGHTDALHGFLLDVYLDYHASAPATTDVTISYAGNGGNVLVVTSSNTDVLHAPRKQLSDSAAAAITDGYDCYALNGALNVAVAQSDDLAPSVTVRIRYLRIA